MNWFKQHLNLTLIVAVVGTYLLTVFTFAPAETTGQGRSVVGSLIQLVNPTISNETMSWLYLPIWLALMSPVEGWVLRKKNRSLWHLLWAIAPFGWIVILCLKNQSQDIGKVAEDDVSKQCLAYLQEEMKLAAFQTREAGLHNEVLLRYGASTAVDIKATSEIVKASERLAEAAEEILRRRRAITSVPDVASSVYFAWETVYQNYSAWASAQATAVSAIANGRVPVTKYVKKLFLEAEKARRKAEGEEKRLGKQLKFSGDEFRKMLNEASVAAENDSWQPQKLKEDDERRNTPKERQSSFLGKDIPLKVIEGEFCRVITFVPFAHIDEKGNVRAMSLTMPYALLHVESPKLPKDTDCSYPVIHKKDFKHVYEAFQEMDSSTQEVLIVYQDNPYKHQRWTKLSKNILPKLHVFIYKKGGLEQIYDESQQGQERFETTNNMKIKEWEPVEGYSD